MHRILEAELMNDRAQAQAYAQANFSEPHEHFVELFKETFPGLHDVGPALDLGCGPADVTIRFMRAFPHCRIDGVDGAENMLVQARALIAQAGFQERIHLVHGVLPQVQLAPAHYATVISNSLLHHLTDPMVLWDSIKRYAKPAAAIFIMDLMRPLSCAQAHSFVAQYAAHEPEILRQDFFNSLCAAFRVDEVRDQLRRAGLDALKVRVVSDRHFVISGRLAD